MPLLMLACNDPDNGMFTGLFGYADMSQAGKEHFLELEGPETRIEFSRPDGNGRLRIGRIIVDCGGEQDWVGNWCWRAYGLPIAEAVRVLAYLRKRGFTPTVGDSVLFRAWGKRELTREDLVKAMEQRR